MPANIKLALSLAVLAVGAGARYWERQQGNEQLSWVIDTANVWTLAGGVTWADWLRAAPWMVNFKDY